MYGATLIPEDFLAMDKTKATHLISLPAIFRLRSHNEKFNAQIDYGVSYFLFRGGIRSAGNVAFWLGDALVKNGVRSIAPSPGIKHMKEVEG